MKTGVELIARERARQEGVEGFDAIHDSGSGHADGQLALAACYYAMPGSVYVPVLRRDIQPEYLYPRDWGDKWAKRGPKERLRQLVAAGALIAAEIDRLQRQENDDAAC